MGLIDLKVDGETGWAKIELEPGVFLQNASGKDAVITRKEAIDRRFRGDYTVVPTKDCAPAKAKVEEE